MGETTCFSDLSPEGGRDPEPRPPPDAPVPMPWATGFEGGFCDFLRQAGYCYVNTEASHAIVRAPVRSGKFAAAFSVSSDDAVDALQSRCVRWGVLPAEAYYGAWYYIPAYAENALTWNLFHFEGWTGETPRRLWDVSIASSGGELRLYVHDFISGVARMPPSGRTIPLGRWFHVSFYLRRAAGATGGIALYQDGELLLELDAVVTDDTERGEWYVGNFADELVPAESTVYVDDVTIRPTL